MRSIGLAAIVVALSSLGLAANSLPDSRQLEGKTQERTTVTQLILRDYEISIVRGTDGEIEYDINSRAGEVLGTNLNEEQLQAKYPHVYDTLRPAIADDTEDSDSMLLMLEPGSYLGVE